MKNKIENSVNKLNLINSWISNCDSKSSYILTFFGVIITIIFTSNVGEGMISSLEFTSADKITTKSFNNFLQLLLFILFLILSSMTLYFTYLTLKARIDPKVYSQEGLVTSSNIFFGSICNKNFKDFNTEIKSESEENYLNDINSQIFINSKIANLKFKNYNLSLQYMLITFCVFLIYIIIK
ncbi:hypothetical protein [Flavobacterium sp.]|uniref:hypothetical protein n=1 Tax=Flavobacterium sp. TaxID=239 RepID=UPI002A823E06|nr:hypothetical protein [Flavobacterium sp.]